MNLRRTPQTSQVFEELFGAPQEWRHGYDISRSTGLKSGTLYPILIRLAELQLLETRWEHTEAGKPPRHLYRLTQGGLRIAREFAAAGRQVSAQEPIFGV
jgi:DNA-binding PadR family transcriptional regulator